MANEKQIRNRKSYTRYKNVAEKLRKLGMPKCKLGSAIQLIHDDVMEKYLGYRSGSAANYAQESINLLKQLYETKNKKAA